MRIDEFVAQQPLFKKMQAEDMNPMVSHYGSSIPEAVLKKFYQQATIDEVALFWFGYHGTDPARFVSILVYLERLDLFDVPIEDGILTPEYWDNWRLNNVVAIMDQGKVFGKC